MSTLPDGAIPFNHPDWSRIRPGWIYWTAGGPQPMTELVGKTVNVGTKDGLVYDAATVAAFTDDGFLTLEGGRKGFPWRGSEITGMTGLESVHCHDIARGYIHPEGTTP